MDTLYDHCLVRGVKLFNEVFVVSLLSSGGRCCGVSGYTLATGEPVVLHSKAVLLATGGCGRIFKTTSMAFAATGDGFALAFDAGVPLEDMEFVQFHPTTLVGTNILMTEGARGEGGYLRNKDGERFMERYVPKAMELAPRDIVSRSIQTEIEAGRGFESELGKYVHLDLRHLGKEKIMERLPGIRSICIDFLGIDPIAEPIPIIPAQHYSMGGIDTNERAETDLKGFYAAGECACVSVHGANRLGGNSLLETIVFGKLGAVAIDEYMQSNNIKPDERTLARKKDEIEKKIDRLGNPGGERPFRILDDLRKTMSEYVGIFRTKGELQTALNKVLEIKERYKNISISSTRLFMNYELAGALELEYMIDVCHIITLGAFLREESRGAHSRRDFAERNDTGWLKHTLATLGPDGEPVISYKDVVITNYQPMERKY